RKDLNTMNSAFRPAARKTSLLVMLAVLLSFSTFAIAQDVASLNGIVTDSSGAVVTGVHVRLDDTKTNASFETETNDVGSYVFTHLPAGPGYKVTFSKEGFDTMSVSDVYLAVNTAHTQNAQLRIGKTSETVEVTGEGAAVSLNTTDATVGNSFDMQLV